jgi:hypothetical protein
MSRGVAASEPLVCPSCARTFPVDERFCPDCRMPLVQSGATGADPAVTEAGRRARKIKRQYAEGDLVRVAFARNQAEAEFIQGMLLEEGVPSTTRRTRGFDVPDFLAAGPRDVLVPESGADAARDVLREADVAETIEPAQPGDRASSAQPVRVLLAVLGGGTVAAFFAWLLVHGSG